MELCLLLLLFGLLYVFFKLVSSICENVQKRRKAKERKQIEERSKLYTKWCEDYSQTIRESLQKEFDEKRKHWEENRNIENSHVLCEKERKLQEHYQSHFQMLRKSDRAAIKKEITTALIERYRQGFENQSQAYPWLAQQYADFLYIYDERTAAELESKSRPAQRAADQVRQIAREKRDLQKQLKAAQYQLNYYETLFPWLEDFKEVDPQEGADFAFGSEEKEEYFKYREWLSPEEYESLPDVEKFQRALDRYMHKPNKSKWRAGIDYERYVGWRFEQQGYTVQYTGALEGLEDMGRDLIATKNGTTFIVQCKRWSAEKTIHEKHIFQLYGSYVCYQMTHDDRNVRCAFYTTTNLSDIAKKCAEFLEIPVQVFPLKKYPVIKCHLADNGEKIYHLPFDQQYDRIRNRQNGRLLYVDTVQEAEDLGYRRAFRWQGEQSN